MATFDERRNIWEIVERTRRGYITYAMGVARKGLEEQVRPLQERLTIADPTNDMVDQLIKRDPIRDALIKIYKTIMKRFAKDTHSFMTKSAGSYQVKDFEEDAVLRAAISYVDQEVAQKVDGITNTTKRQIKGVIATALQEGRGIDSIQGDLDKLVKQRYRNRARTIARTEIIPASNLGAIKGADQAGVEYRKEWISTLDTRTRDARFNHRRPDGKTVERNNSFLISGQKMMFPGDASLGATAGNIINCRCAVGFQPV